MEKRLFNFYQEGFKPEHFLKGKTQASFNRQTSGHQILQPIRADECVGSDLVVVDTQSAIQTLVFRAVTDSEVARAGQICLVRPAFDAVDPKAAVFAVETIDVVHVWDPEDLMVDNG